VLATGIITFGTITTQGLTFNFGEAGRKLPFDLTSIFLVCLI
jgi:hypothetical protein